MCSIRPINFVLKPGCCMLRFTKDQRIRLKELKVNDLQISEIEEKVLIAARHHIRKLPTLTDVRDEFGKLNKALNDAQDTMSELLRADADEEISAKGEVFERILREDFKMQGDGEFFEKTLRGIAVVKAIAVRARKKLPTEQRRKNEASPFPVQLIADALIRNNENNQTIRPSSSPTSQFFKIVEICYEKIKGKDKNQDPSRAIRAYLLRLKEHS